MLKLIQYSSFHLFVLFAINTTSQASICTLAGNYANTSQFQNAINTCSTSDTVKLTGSAQWSGNITVVVDRTLVIASSATMNGSGTLTSTNPIVITSGATFTMSAGSTVSVNGNTFNGPVSS